MSSRPAVHDRCLARQCYSHEYLGVLVRVARLRVRDRALAYPRTSTTAAWLISPMLAPSDPVTPGIMPDDLVRLARVHEASFAYLPARLPRLFASIAGSTRRHDVPNAQRAISDSAAAVPLQALDLAHARAAG